MTGRLSTGFIAPYVGVPRLMIIATAACGILILGMIALDRIPTIVVLGTMYGYFAGVRQLLFFSYVVGSGTEQGCPRVDIALLAPLMAFLTSDLSELGFVVPTNPVIHARILKHR